VEKVAEVRCQKKRKKPTTWIDIKNSITTKIEEMCLQKLVRNLIEFRVFFLYLSVLTM